MSLAKCSMGALEQSFLEFLEQPVKIEDFTRNCKQLLSRMFKTKWENEENQIFLNKNDPTAPRSFLLNIANQLRK